jgi:hypothetical protein
MRGAIGVAVLVAWAGIAAPAAGQGINLQIVPKIGGFFPANELGATRLGSDSRLESGLAIGLAGELVLPALPVNVRANLEYAPSVDLTFAEGVGRREGNNLLLLVGDVVLRPFPATAGVQPYLLLGAGLKRYEFDDDAAPRLGTRRDVAFHVGVGLDYPLGPLALVAELSDYVSRFAQPRGAEQGSRIQNDLFAMVGFRIGMF